VNSGTFFDTRQLGPSTRVVETGRPCTRAVYTGVMSAGQSPCSVMSANCTAVYTVSPSDPCAKFGDFSLSSFRFIVRTNRQTHAHNYRITDAAERFTPTNVNNYVSNT